AEALDRARHELEQATFRVAATVLGIDATVEVARQKAKDSRDRAVAAKERARLAGNDRDRKQRWSRGLQRLALEYDVAEAQRLLAEAEALADEIDRELRCAGAAAELKVVRRIDAELEALREALARAREDVEPLRRAAC